MDSSRISRNNDFKQHETSLEVVLEPRWVPLYLRFPHELFPLFSPARLLPYLLVILVVLVVLVIFSSCCYRAQLKMAIFLIAPTYSNKMPWKTYDSYTNHLVFRWWHEMWKHWASQTLVQPEQRNRLGVGFMCFKDGLYGVFPKLGVPQNGWWK